jgi:hypothetical protein
MTQAYVGRGLPRFTERTLKAHVRRHCGEDVVNEITSWLKPMRTAYKMRFGRPASLTFDALDLMKAYSAARLFAFRNNLGSPPCYRGVLRVLCQMLTPNVAAALTRNIADNRTKWSRGRHVYRCLAATEPWDIPDFIRILEKAKGEPHDCSV